MHEFLGAGPIEEVLNAVGEQLASRGSQVSVIVVGGATLNILGIVRRSTSDVDVIAQAHRADDGTLVLAHAQPFPEPLVHAIRTVARDFGLAEDWMNSALGKQWSQGMPPTIDQELTWRRYGGLEVGFVGRRTLIALKLFAAVDTGPRSVHVQDLLEIAPTANELQEASNWVKTQDASPDFLSQVEQVVAYAQRHSTKNS